MKLKSPKLKKIIAVLAAAAALTSLLGASGTSLAASDSIVLAIDPGHGGTEIGTAMNGVGEKEYTLRLAQLLKKKLEAKGGFKVCLTRTGDSTMEVYERGVYANSVNADALISLHFDGSANASEHGVTVYTSVISSCAMTALGSSVSSALSNATGLANNGIRQRSDTGGYYWNFERQWDIKDPSLGVLSDYYGIPTWAAKFGIPSMIIEHGFMSNAGDRTILSKGGTLEKMAQAEADVLASYYLGHTHTYSAARVDYPSNCMYRGKQSEHCKICGHRRNVTNIAASPDNHYWVQTSYVPAKCGQDGRITYTCRITDNLIDKGCKMETHKKVTVLPAPSQHNYREAERVEATHTVDGYVAYECSNCGNRFKDILKAEGHTWEYVSYTEPACTETGGKLYRCNVCGGEYTETEAATGHKWGDSEKTVPATCTESGSRQAKCTVCGFELYEELAPLGHDESACITADPTCTENGSVKGNCARCKAEIDRELPAKGHSFEETVVKEATCTEAGEVRRVCKNCKAEETEDTSPTGHSFLPTSYLAPTCTEDGKSELVCSGCGAVFSAPVPSAGHNFRDGEIIKRAGLFTAGKSRLTCSECGVTKEVKIASVLPAAVLPFAVFALLASAAAVLVLLRSRKNRSGRPHATAPEAEIYEVTFTEADGSSAAETAEIIGADNADQSKTAENAETNGNTENADNTHITHTAESAESTEKLSEAGETEHGAADNVQDITAAPSPDTEPASEPFLK